MNTLNETGQKPARIREVKPVYQGRGNEGKFGQILNRLRVVDETEYWRLMYEWEKEKHYKVHHPETYDPNRHQEESFWHQCQTDDSDCVRWDINDG